MLRSYSLPLRLGRETACRQTGTWALDDQDPDIADWDPATALRWEREIKRDGEGKNIGGDKKDRRKREGGSKRWDGVERKGKGIAKKGETTKGTALHSYSHFTSFHYLWPFSHLCLDSHLCPDSHLYPNSHFCHFFFNLSHCSCQ